MWSDVESNKDYLNFGEVSELAVEIISSENMLPTSIGIFGNWGAGKSSLLQLVEHQLEQDEGDYLVIKFDAWLYQGFDDAKSALLEVIATELINQVADNEGLKEKGVSLLKRVNKFRLLGYAAEGTALAFGMPTGGIVARLIGSVGGAVDGIQGEEYKEAAEVVKDGKKELQELINDEKQKSPPQQIHEFRQEYSELIKELGKTVVVVIDNLDRCMPANAIHTLEAIRLFLFLERTAFVIAADEDMIKSSVASHFKGTSKRHHLDYIDKLIQVPIRVPRAGIREIRAYLFMLYAIDLDLADEQLDQLRTVLENDLQLSWKQDYIPISELCSSVGIADLELRSAFSRAERIAPILATSPKINANPRTVKRLLNIVKMRSKVSKRREMHLDEAIITKLVILERCIGPQATQAFYQAIDSENGHPEFLQQLESIEDESTDIKFPESWDDSAKNFAKEWSQLAPTLSDVDLKGAVYLSRETIPMGSYAVNLSPQAREAIKVLSEVDSTASPKAKEIIAALAQEEKILVMEALISLLRKQPNWAEQPRGFSGARLLAENDAVSGNTLARFISERNTNEPWLNRILKNSTWNKG